MSANKRVDIPTTTKHLINGFIRRVQSTLSFTSQTIPYAINYIVILYFTITISFQAAPCHAYTLTNKNKTLIKSSDCGCGIDAHVALFNQSILHSMRDYIYIWEFKIDDIGILENIMIHLVSQPTPMNNNIQPTKTEIISSWDSAFDSSDCSEIEHKFAAIKKNDIISCIINVTNCTFMISINRQRPMIAYTNLSLPREQIHTMAVAFEECPTSITLLENVTIDTISPVRQNANIINIRTYDIDCFICANSISCKDVSDYILHLRNDFKTNGKIWLHCIYPGCNENFTRERDFVFHIFVHYGMKPYQCIISTNDVICSERFARLDVFLKHANHIHYKYDTPINNNDCKIPKTLSPATPNYNRCVKEETNCPICKVDFFSWDSFADKNHLSQCFPNKLCPHCNMICTTPSKLIINLQTCYRFRILSCNVLINGFLCGESCLSKQKMKGHFQKHYSDSNAV